MKKRVTLDAVYAASEDVVARKIEGDIIIIPCASGSDDAEHELYTLNPAGQAVCQRLDGSKSLKEIVSELTAEFKSPAGEIEKDVVALVRKLLKRKMLVEISGI